MWASRNPLLRFIGHTQFLSRIINYNSILTSIDFNATVVTLTKPPSYIENRFKPADPYNIKVPTRLPIFGKQKHWLSLIRRRWIWT
ncbi:hypothetical protein ABKN59_008739 [Abortiporus biennis]